MPPDSNNRRPIGERLREDRRSTSELVDAVQDVPGSPLVQHGNRQIVAIGRVFPALHGLARRGDKRVVPHHIAELSAEPERVHVFVDAAKTFIGIDEDTKVDSDLMLARLRALQSGV